MLRQTRLLAGLLFCCFAASATAQNYPRVPAARIATPPVIDGVLTAGEWDKANQCESFTDRLTTRPAAEKTTGWIAYDDKAISWAMYVHESDPSRIIAREIQPGANFDNDDHVALDLNPFNTRSYNGTSSFKVNALGNTNEDISGGRTAKREWRGEWTAKVTRVADGWTMEARIPWKILNFPGGKAIRMDFNMIRFQAGPRIASEFASLGQAGRPELRAEWLDVTPPNVGIERPWSFLTYLAAEADGSESGLRAGVDARYRFSETLTGLVSVNPDFKNIEGQIAGIEFTRTERFISDVRPFFTEGGGFFGLGSRFGFGQLFYSQRIQTFDAGAKAYGQLNKDWSIGALATYDRNAQSVGIAKVRRDFGNLGRIEGFASATQDDFTQDQTLGAAGSFRQGNLSGSATVAASRQDAASFASMYEAGVNYEAPRFFTTVRYNAITPDFNPQLGYIPWTDRKGYYTYTSLNKEMRHGPFRYANLEGGWSEYFTYQNEAQEKGYSFSGRVGLRNDTGIGFGHDETRYYGSPDNVWFVNVAFNENNRFRNFSVFYEKGLRDDMDSEYLSIGLTRRVAKGLDLGFNQSINKFQGTDRLTIATVGYELNPNQSFNGRLVTRDGKTNAYVAFRQSGNRGVEYFVILGDPNADQTVSRLSLKAVWAF
jgi:hypothetical protein